MHLIKRQGVIVWLYTLKNLNQLKRLGYVHYVSNRMKYAIMYVNNDLTETVVEKLQQLHFVRSVELSYRDNIDMTFKDSITPDLENDEESFFDKEFFEEITQQIKEHQAQD